MVIYINSKGEEKNVEEMDSNHLLNSYRKAIILWREGIKFVIGDTGITIDEQVAVLRDEILRRIEVKQ